MDAVSLYQRDNVFSVWHIGEVIDNNDPKKLGRIRVKIPYIMEYENTEDYPWIYPVWGGLGSPFGIVMIPRVGSKVLVVFPYRNEIGFYIGTANLETSRQDVGDANYPDTYGFKDSNGNVWRINLTTNEISVIHTSGSSISIDGSGNITISSVGNITISATGNVTIQGSRIDLNP